MYYTYSNWHYVQLEIITAHKAIMVGILELCINYYDI